MTYRILSTLVQTFAGVTAHGRNVVISLNKRGTVDVSFDVIDIYIPREREKKREFDSDLRLWCSLSQFVKQPTSAFEKVSRLYRSHKPRSRMLNVRSKFN